MTVSAVSGKYRIGTRKSALATTQSRQILDALAAQGIHCVLVEMASPGDADRKTPLYEIEAPTPGLFTKHLEQALLANEIDIAVHSLKDLPTSQPAGLVVAAVSRRVDSDDTLLVRASRHDASRPLGLPEGAVVGTSSLRREAQLLAERPDLKIIPVRGNVPTRVNKARDGEVDAVVLAEAGIFRLGLELKGLVKVALPREGYVSAPGQGALAIETRVEIPAALRTALDRLNDPASEKETRIERKVLQGLHGGCTLPLGVRCEAAAGGVSLKAFLGLAAAGRKWTSFHRFELTEKDEAVLVDKTVSHFKRIMEGQTK